MKIGILTFHCAHNYGAVLQCYALQETLKSMGHDVHIINYRPNYLESRHPSIGYRSILSVNFIKNIQHYKMAQESFRLFQSFERCHFMLTDICVTKDELIDLIQDFDYIVIGSDQVWNKKYNGNDSIWLGAGFNRKGDTPKLISYAASSGNVDFDTDDENLLIDNLSHFKAISVREKSLKDKLCSLLPNIKVVQTLDPSLMADKNIWAKWFRPILNDKYILVYQARPDNNVYRIAEEFALQLKAKVLTVDFYKNRYAFECEQIVVSPLDFLSIVRNAQCVVTTSFHGTAFSIITNTPFYTIKLNDGADERSMSLLEMLGLKDRMIEKNSKPQFTPIDFSKVEPFLNEQKILSQSFLKENIL